MAKSWWDRLIVPLAAGHAQLACRRFFRATRNAATVQDRVLRAHLQRHGESDFGRQHGFNRVTDYRQFTAAVPVAGYDAFSAYIARVRRGDTTALLGPRQRVLMFALTSGTTAESKYIPVTREFLSGYQHGWNVWGLKALLDHPGSFLRCIVQVSSPMCDHTSESGAPCGAITGLLAASQKRLVRKYYVAPLVVAGIRDAAAKYYAIMRLAIPSDVAFLVTANPATLLQLARTADASKEHLIRDIHDGALRSDLPIDDVTRAALRQRLRADPALARRLEILVNANGALRPRDYWRLTFLAHWTGGTMGLYRPYFAEWYGDTPVRDVGLLASEGRMSIPIEDSTPSGVLDVTTQFYEFIPAESYGRGAPPTLRCHEVQVGHEYFLVLTNPSGLCRYDIGDRVRVTGWLGTAPQIEFLSKGAHTSSLAGEKLTEDQVVRAMQALASSGIRVPSSFVLAPQFAEQPSYRLYVDADLMNDCPADLAQRLDVQLRSINIEYDSKRDTDRLGQIALCRLPARTLAERDQSLRAASSSRIEQFKHQYLLPRPGMDADWAGTSQPQPIPSRKLTEAAANQ